MKKIAFYIGNLARGGAQRVVVNLADYFYKEGYETIIVTAKWEEGEYPYEKGIGRIISDLTKEESSRNRIINFYRRMRKLRTIWRRESPDVILSFMGKSNLNALITAGGLKIPVLVSVRSDPNREYGTKFIRLLSKTLFGFASGIVLQTEESIQYFPKRLHKKIVIMPNSLDVRFIRPRFEGNRRKEIVSVGAIDDNKNHKLLIEAFIRLEKEFPEWKVAIYGEGALREELTAAVKEKGLADKIVLPGKENATYEKIYDASIFVLTSFVEGMPNALIEAMALGLAVISTDCPCGGPRMLIQDGINGILIPVNDRKALEQSLRYLMKEEHMLRDLGSNAHQIGVVLAPEKVNLKWKNYIESKMV